MLFCLPISFAPKRSGKAGSYIIGTALLLLVYNVQMVLRQQVHSGHLPWWTMWLGQFLLLAMALWAFRRACQDRLPSPLLFVKDVGATVHQKVMLFVGRRSDIHRT